MSIRAPNVNTMSLKSATKVDYLNRVGVLWGPQNIPSRIPSGNSLERDCWNSYVSFDKLKSATLFSNPLPGRYGCLSSLNNAGRPRRVSLLKSNALLLVISVQLTRSVNFFPSLLADVRTFARHLESWVLTATVELPEYLKMGKVQGESVREICGLSVFSRGYQVKDFDDRLL